MKKIYVSPSLELDTALDVIRTSAEVETGRVPFKNGGATESSVAFDAYVNEGSFELD